MTGRTDRGCGATEERPVGRPTGVCHTCETRLISGAVDYLPDPVEPPATGNLLICCTHPTTDLTVDL